MELVITQVNQRQNKVPKIAAEKQENHRRLKFSHLFEPDKFPRDLYSFFEGRPHVTFSD